MKRIKKFNPSSKYDRIDRGTGIGRMRILGVLKPSEKGKMFRGYNGEYLRQVWSTKVDLPGPIVL